MIGANSAKARAIIRLDQEVPVPVVEGALVHLLGVVDFEINPVNGTVKVEFDPQKVTVDDIRNVVKGQAV